MSDFMSASNILRALSIALLLILIIIDSLYGVIIKLVLVIVIAALFYLSFHVENNKQNHDAESILVVVFFISLVGLSLIFSSSQVHIIVDPNAFNETFTFPNDVSGSNCTISIKNLGNNAVELKFVAKGNNIIDNNDINVFANQLRNNIKTISDNASTLENSGVDAKSNNSINENITYIKANIDNLANGQLNPSPIFKNICRAIDNITTTKTSQENGSKPLSEATITLINDLNRKLASMKSDIANNSAIFISLISSAQIESEKTEYVSVGIDPSMATANGEYKGAIIIRDCNNMLHKEVPISIKIKGITRGSTESKAKENKSVAFKSVTLNLTGSLAN